MRVKRSGGDGTGHRDAVLRRRIGEEPAGIEALDEVGGFFDSAVDPSDPGLDGGQRLGEVDHVVVAVVGVGDLGAGFGAQRVALLV